MNDENLNLKFYEFKAQTRQELNELFAKVTALVETLDSKARQKYEDRYDEIMSVLDMGE